MIGVEHSSVGRLRRIVIVTTSRADFGISAPVIAALRQSLLLDPVLLVSGNHAPLEKTPEERTRTAAVLGQSAGIPVAGIMPMPLGNGTASDIAEAMSVVTAGAARALAAGRPDILLVVGDRYEMHAIVVAASALRVPVAHIHGGEESQGAIDNLYRHSITKLSHLHFCTTELSRQRILSMGEEPWRVHVTGAPALDGLSSLSVDTRAALLARLDLPDIPFFLATFHPETLDVEGSFAAFEALIASLDTLGVTTVFSRANADESGQTINMRLEKYAQTRSWLHIRDSLGRQGYFSAMRHADLMIGNSSSGIIEAASFGLPVVNIGERQAGRERSPNTIDAEARASAILQAIETARSAPFRAEARVAGNVYEGANASMTICRILEQAPSGRELLKKRFYLPGGE